MPSISRKRPPNRRPQPNAPLRRQQARPPQPPLMMMKIKFARSPKRRPLLSRLRKQLVKLTLVSLLSSTQLKPMLQLKRRPRARRTKKKRLRVLSPTLEMAALPTSTLGSRICKKLLSMLSSPRAPHPNS